MNDLLPRGLRYHIWANDRVMNILRREQEPPKETVTLFAHVVWADHLWLQRSGVVEETPDRSGWTEDMDRVTLGEHWNQVREVWQRMIGLFEKDAATMESELGRTVDYTNTKGDHYSKTFGEILQHVINHGTHHRAQIARILREHGDTPPVLDMIAFFREQ